MTFKRQIKPKEPRIKDIKPKMAYTSIRVSMESKTFLEAVRDLNHLNGLDAAIYYMKDANIKQQDRIGELKEQVKSLNEQLAAYEVLNELSEKAIA